MLFPPPGDLPDPGINPCILDLLHWQADSLPLSHLGSHIYIYNIYITYIYYIYIGEGNGNPLQCSCMENPRDGGAWWAAVYGAACSQTRLKRLSSSSSSTQSCLTLCDPMDYTVYGILQANTGVGSLSLLQGSSQLRDQTQVSCIAGGFFTRGATGEAPQNIRTKENFDKVVVRVMMKSQSRIWSEKWESFPPSLLNEHIHTSLKSN